ncbi:predicted protein [Listeria monocytogenes FSL J2-071]|nr:predicted protein [Listeria monocytogenes FSL J2-071]
MNYLLGKNSAHITFKKAITFIIVHKFWLSFTSYSLVCAILHILESASTLQQQWLTVFLIFFVKKRIFQEKSAFSGDDLF